MIGSRLRLLPFLLLAMTSVPSAAELPRMYQPSLSPDARYLAYRSPDEAGGGMALELLELGRDDARRRLLDPATAGTLAWCMWGNSERLVCSQVEADGATRLIAVDAASGGIAKVLVARASSGGDPTRRPIVVDWLREDPRHMLIRLYSGDAAWPSVQRLDLYDGTLEEQVAAQAPIREFVSDQDGEVRFGLGEEGEGRFGAFARLGKARLWKRVEWKRLSRFPASPAPEGLWPLPGERVISEQMRVVARTPAGDTVWKVDLTDRTDPEPGPTGRMRPMVSPMNESLGTEYPDRELKVHWRHNGERVLELVHEERPGGQDRIVDYVMNPSSYVIESRRGSKEPAKVLLYAHGAGGFKLREVGVLAPSLPAGVAVGHAAPAAGAAKVNAPAPAAPGPGEELEVLITVTDPSGKTPVADLPLRLVLSSDPDPRGPDAGRRYVTDAKGRVRDGLRIVMESRRVGLDIPLVTHKARGFELGLEIGMGGMPLLYTLTLDEVKRSTLISARNAYTRDGRGSFTREVDLDWLAMASDDRDVYLFPPRDPKTFDPLPDPPPSRLTMRNLQMLSHPRADGSKRWTLELRLTLDPFRPLPGG
jgi:hypothetical protein